MSKSFDYKLLEYLDLEIQFPDNYSLCRRITTDNNKIVCRLKESYNHKLHSHFNSENCEQLNTVIDLLCNLSEKLKINCQKQIEPIENKTQLTTNIGYLKELLEDIHKKLKENNNLTEKIKHLETEVTKNNKLLEIILYGKQST